MRLSVLRGSEAFMAYDITNPDKILFANYINSRDFSKDIAGDVSPKDCAGFRI